MKKRVVVTGLGIVSPLGNDPQSAYDNAIAGKNCVENITSFDTEGLKVKIAAQVKDFESEKYLTKREARRQDLFSQYAVYASIEALKDAKLYEAHNPDDLGIVMGTGMGGMITFANDLNKAFVGGYSKIPPMFIPMIIPNMASGNVAIAVDAKNHSTTVTTACAAATHAIGDAFRHIQRGYAEMMIAGGTEAGVNPYTLAGFNAITALSTTEEPSKASRPFDKDRNGFVLGEGSGILILESLEHALARNAKIYCEVVGYGSTSDAYHITAPSGLGAVKAMENALKDANLKPEDVDYINAHGTSTPINDKFETEAIKAVFKDHAYKLKISSTKSMHGHALGATGGIEAVLSIKAMQEGIIPPTINLETQDEECDLDYVPNIAIKKDIDVFMSNSLGFGGHNAILLFRKYES
ncbi:MAG: beta-ketoacyl-ACP synthase II [Erysipelothrix sp.]|nr:beta-ketoacyl-ACP synthase II [Erysipelothrix sp.]